MTANASAEVQEKVAGLANLAGKYLTFKLGDEAYGLEILKVQEIIGITNVTHVPRLAGPRIGASVNGAMR